MKPANDHGFTLLEIIVSLAIAALGIAAVAKATGSAATTAAETKERVLAVWVASNHLSELKIARAWPTPGGYEDARTMGGRTWYLTRTVHKTDLPTIRRVEVEVYPEEQRQRLEYRSFGYIARYQPPQQSGGEEASAEAEDESGQQDEPSPDEQLESEVDNAGGEGEP